MRNTFAPNAVRTIAALRTQPEMLAAAHVRQWFREVLVSGPLDAAAGIGSILEDRATITDAEPIRVALRSLVRKHRRIQDVPGALALLYALAHATGQPRGWAHLVALGQVAF